LAFSIVLVFLSGCGSGPKYVPVAGTVTLNNKPFGDAEIRFVPDPGNTWITPGLDVTGPAGNYKAMSGGRSGLSAGKYKVVITQKPPGSDASASGDSGIDPHMKEIMDEAGREGRGKAAAKKAAPIKGTFDAEIKADQSVYDFDVKAATS
jgi:hypothetical protein